MVGSLSPAGVGDCLSAQSLHLRIYSARVLCLVFSPPSPSIEGLLDRSSAGFSALTYILGFLYLVFVRSLGLAKPEKLSLFVCEIEWFPTSANFPVQAKPFSSHSRQATLNYCGCLPGPAGNSFPPSPCDSAVFLLAFFFLSRPKRLSFRRPGHFRQVPQFSPPYCLWKPVIALPPRKTLHDHVRGFPPG